MLCASFWLASNQVRRPARTTPASISDLWSCLYPPEARSAEEVEDYLASLMDQEFDTIVEDGSISQVLYAYFREIYDQV